MSTRRLMSPAPRGSAISNVYKSEASAKKRVAELRGKGYNARYEEIMGSYSVWVSAKYFKDTGKKSYYGVY